MIRKTKLEKLSKSYNENICEFGTKYLEFSNSKKDIPEGVSLSDLGDFILEDANQMRNLIRIAAHSFISTIEYVEFLEKKIK